MLHLREATGADVPALCALGNEVNELHHRAWPQLFASKGADDRDREHWQRGVGRADATTFVAERDSRVVAFVTVALIDETHSLLQALRYARIGSICVAGIERGKGIGPALMASAEAWATGHGATDLRLNVWTFNEHALHVYKELGYEVRSVNLGKSPPRTA